ncbi:MAG: glycerol-3-phosphate 1-O-acyltransferase PlsY [Lachnospiraceae bacterium]|nr:glycerol-3-phosphate 1-O-acyltransferase PlsY [Lachnospiraceae bacterium]
MTVRLICLVIGYVFGLFQTSYLYGRKFKGMDIRSQGSGNAGTTNAIRVFGKKAGLLTVLCDVCKCILAMLLTGLIFRHSYPEILLLLKVYTAAGVVLGHVFPFYMNFRGGKGVACFGGMILAFGDWRMIVLGLIFLLGCLLITKYMSLGSLTATLSFLIGVIIRGQAGAYQMDQSHLTEMYCIIGLLVVLTYYKHRGNIVRLLKGEERKTYIIGKPKES